MKRAFFPLVMLSLTVSAQTDADADRFIRACEKGDSRALPALALTFASWPPDSPRKLQTFPALADLWFRVQAERLSRQPPAPAVFPEFKAALPEYLRGQPDEFAEVWRCYWRVTKPYKDLCEKSRTLPVIPYRENKADYWNLVGRLLTEKPTPDVILRLRQFEHEGNSLLLGNGPLFNPPPSDPDEGFWACRWRADLMALLLSNRHAETVGALLSNNFYDLPLNLRIQLLNAYYPSWKKAALGVILARDYDFSYTSERWLFLHGNENDVRMILAIKQINPRPFHDFVPGEMSFLISFVNRAKPPISSKLKQKIVTYICDQTNLTHWKNNNADFAQELQQLNRPESIAALKKLLRSPSAIVRLNAMRSLQHLQVPMQWPDKPPTASFRILLNGKPEPRLPDGTLTVTSQTWDKEVSDKTPVPAPEFFYYHPAQDHIWSDSWENLQAPYYLAKIYWRGNKIIDINTRPFAIHLTLEASSRPSPKNMDFRMKFSPEPEDVGGDNYGNARIWFHEVPWRTTIRFAALHPGRYHCELSVPGYETWTAVVDTQKQDEIKVFLPLTSEVSIPLKCSDTTRSEDFIRAILRTATLLRDGQPTGLQHEFGKSNYYNFAFEYPLTAGTYTLKMPAGEDLAREMEHHYRGPSLKNMKLNPPQIEFTIPKDAPAQMTLPEIKLDVVDDSLIRD